MDDIDKKILKLLSANARATLSELAGEIALSLPAISERLKKLEASGVIRQYTTILDPAKLNKHLMALMFLRFDNPKHGDRFAELSKAEPEIKECYYITGDFDYSLKILTENTGTLEKLLTRIKNAPGVVKTQTIVILSTITDSPSVQPD
ncbi:Lrp/AsnC family transcriptional regulator [Schwartzia succinivorans]|jgi:Lrp/AsnC family leucine-responsive transcriptional regulator|uniref:Lrp/AsnC family transcriptional regulator, leucine-responsive regulatory protein n=1 Tax=Schwartzia succinivorans DSM 10502 TaxID=1123243 RepID=A0A1M4SSD7_9FIRM|nr:Lrp/AsnC family transcriptional regulator [Schwartzia succinivorans]MBQ1470290.1 Lrp/AsnC family transcriptional regulator [Schwartzia sp. (in: firmicutes)]MBE6097284.1 Lrp/AsnC family transcriptional regulator [Schwartzia succinivorans]MBQ1918274.1 Lrp/AsnC family transcriptional regulator [Schwartzia sp. (in: firmicutes)]MBQ3863868.1 Lrp/AsnC family transcriptional regulator [Schwartzia sp. (in: firmicutes)]MBQ4152289.1 Lrp/AsnC family transcriptional regulator [Schwartzia sp. (in: firmic